MSKKNKRRLYFIWQNVLLPLLILLVLVIAVYNLMGLIPGIGYNALAFSTILIFSLIIGVSHVVIYFLRRKYEKSDAKGEHKKRRRLERFRNGIGYLTPFILLGMLYHFWQRDWVLASVIVLVLLFDRLNELVRINK